MLLRMLDNHPQLQVVPHEWSSPFTTDLEPDPWSALQDPKAVDRYQVGIKQANGRLSGDRNRVPLDLDPAKHRSLFRPGGSPRETYDAFLSSYFEAWKGDEQTAAPRWRCVFAPRLILSHAGMEAFTSMYPDGRLISVVREPAGWWASARRWSPEWEKLDTAAEYWVKGVRAMRYWHNQLGDRSLVLPFSELVGRPKRTAWKVADWLNIDRAASLLQQTVGGSPVGPNSSFDTGAAAQRGDTLTENERERLAELTGRVAARVRT